jgi:hypothetical protein
MPFVVSLLSGFVTSTVVKALLTRALVALGISALTYTGVSVAMASLVSSINTNIGGLAPSTVSILMLCDVPQAFNVVLSAYAGALALKGLTAAGAITKYGVSTSAGSVFSPGSF